MSEFKGTKGEWQVVDDYENYIEYSPENPQIYIWNGDEQAHKPICDMGEMGDMNYAEELSNAHLIASAPELLEALIKCRDLFDMELTPSDKQCHEHWKVCETAINKALNLTPSAG